MNEQYSQQERLRQRGAALLELAILMPVLVVLLFGLVELGRALLQANTLNKAVTTGVRYVARAPDAVARTTDSNGNVTACATGSTWSTVIAQAELLIENDNAGAGSEILADLEATFSTPRFETRTISLPGGGSQTVSTCVVAVQAEAPFAAILGDSLVPFFQVGPITLNAQAEERYIGE